MTTEKAPLPDNVEETLNDIRELLHIIAKQLVSGTPLYADLIKFNARKARRRIEDEQRRRTLKSAK